MTERNLGTDAWIGNRVTDREMVDDLSLLRCEIEVAVHFIIEERANSCCPESQGVGGKIKTLSDRSRLKMYVAIAAIAMGTDGAINVRNHGKRNARVSGKVLPKAESCCCYALIAGPDLLQLCVLRPISVHAWFQPLDAMYVQVKLNESGVSEIRGKRLGRRGENSRELRKRYGFGPATEIERRSSRPCNFAKGEQRCRWGRQFDLA